MNKKTILALTPGHPGQLETLERDYRVLRLWKERDPEATLTENAPQIEAITGQFKPVGANLMKAMPNLKVVALGTVGYDNVDLKAANDLGVTVTNTPDVLTEDTADTGMCLVMSLARRIVEGDAFVRAGMWKNQELPLGRSLKSKTMGILGLGAIGKAVAKRAQAFGMSIQYHGRTRQDVPYAYCETLEQLATASDFLMCTCPGGEATKHLIDYNILGHLGSKGYLINIARGSVVNEEDLLIALKNKTIAGAGLDVYENEPNVPESLFVMDNVVLTPHIGSATHETRKIMGQLVVDNIKNCLNGEAPLTPVK